VDVEVDGQHDNTIAEAWAEYAEEFVPSRLSHLFFFDGEKIETLADLRNAADVLRTGIHSLLGLDLVDRLHDDLEVVASRKEKLLTVDESTGLALHAAEADVLALRSRRDELFQALAGAQGEIQQCKYHLQQAEERLHNEGGELFAQKDTLENSRRALLAEIDGLDNALREVAVGCAPLLLVPKLLTSVQNQAHMEAQSTQATLLDDLLRERDALVISKIAQLGNKSIEATVAEFLAADRRQRTAKLHVRRYLHISEGAERLMQDLTTVSLPGARQKIVEILARRKDLANTLVSVERKLSTVPEEDAIAPVERLREELNAKHAALLDRLERLQEEKQRTEHELSRKEGTLRRLQEEAARRALEQEDLARITEHARRSQSALNAFRERIVERHLSRIEESVTDSFRHLLRKQALVKTLHIDPRTYALELRDAEGTTLLPERLSAGERQLLAVSLVWGLAKASRRPLPAVIDTPLGRLDSLHRQHLVDRYFPKASHQVLLLSTDEEIRGTYFECLRPSIGHSYLLQYDESARTSTVQPGYFPMENGNAA
jgi:DNA sulfur modification protein DndD